MPRDKMKFTWEPPEDFKHLRQWFFEGLDKTGKTTLTRRCRFEAVPAHPALMFDRGYVGRTVFWHVNNEADFPIEDWGKAEMALMLNGMYGIVWLRASPMVCVEREIAAGEVKPEDKGKRCMELEQHQALFNRLIESRKRQGVPVIEVWTDRTTEDKCVQQILNKMGFSWKEHAKT